MNKRWGTLLARSEEQPKVKHHIGLPPEVAGARDTRHELPAARVLLIEEKDDGIFLTRFSIDGIYAGDTWHTTLDEAKGQAVFEYGPLLSDWRELPSDVLDPIAFVLSNKPEGS